MRNRADAKRERPTSWSALVAAMLDAGFSALATFATGIFAARALTHGEFGVYALFFSGVFFASAVPTFLFLEPAAIATVAQTEISSERLGLFHKTWRLGTGPALIAGAAVAVVASLSAGAPHQVVVPLAITSCLCSVVSPLQDHLRLTLHLGRRSWSAMLVSSIQLATVIATLRVLGIVGVDQIWRPFTALAAANLLSLEVGVALARRGRPEVVLPTFEWRALVESGRWLLAFNAAAAGSLFVSSAVVTRFAGAAALGHAEAARLMAQPLFVLAAALHKVTWSASMEAAAERDRKAAQEVARLCTAVMVGAGLLYGALTIAPWKGNPFSGFLPQAYAVRGLVMVSVLAHVLLGCITPFCNELLGAGRSRDLGVVGMRAGVLQSVTAMSAQWIGAFARPLGVAVFSMAMLLGYQPTRRRLYRERPVTTPDPEHPDPYCVSKLMANGSVRGERPSIWARRDDVPRQHPADAG